MRKSGVRIPINVMRAGIDTDYFRYYPRPKDGLFKVLILGALTGRKNPMGAIRIFQKASDGNPDWRVTSTGGPATALDKHKRAPAHDEALQDPLAGHPPPTLPTVFPLHHPRLVC